LVAAAAIACLSGESGKYDKTKQGGWGAPEKLVGRWAARGAKIKGEKNSSSAARFLPLVRPGFELAGQG
jgi:hypothetical protein